MSDEEFGICPFNTSHRIVLYRMPAHIVKCRKNYSGPPLEQCIYNATHYVPMGTMQSHLQQCRDCYRFNQTKYVEIAAKSIKQDV
ncbi:hypothetical protein FF38_03936 [Lucilia cuprina]|uniref:CHHC U11-48K-type domain-containing protein n=1 Tax=Lucilia cuprina TaxID=7375 RepID=A0A0L0CDJ7_LUCCU|nr:Gametocyte-specific factor 1 [Lucilia cuprina]KNC30321.1 hypothetical protein FF38_03936 [Lucilia cuprina]